MNVIYHDRINQAPEILPFAKQAMLHLEDMVGPSGSSATAEWDRDPGEPQPAITLKLRDFIGEEVDGKFEPWS